MGADKNHSIIKKKRDR